MRNSNHNATLILILMVGIWLCAPALADNETGHGFAASGERFGRPSDSMEEEVSAFPESDLQRYVITKGKNGNNNSAMRIEYIPSSERASLAETPVLAVNTALAEEILLLTNQARAQHGLSPVQANQTLAIAAVGHSTEMVALNYFDHTSPTPGLVTPQDRVHVAGAHPGMVSENLFAAEGYPTEGLARVVVDSWLSSPGHRANLLDPRATHTGLGVVEKNGQVCVTEMFAGNMR